MVWPHRSAPSFRLAAAGKPGRRPRGRTRALLILGRPRSALFNSSVPSVPAGSAAAAMAQ